MNKKVYDSILKDLGLKAQKYQSNPNHSWLAKSILEDEIPKIQNLKKLDRYPSNPFEIKNLGTKFKAKILKDELKNLFPKTKFRVKSDHYSGGSSINVFWEDGASSKKVQPVIKKYQTDLGSDPMTDYFNYDNYAFGQRSISEKRMSELKAKLKKEKNLPDWDLGPAVHQYTEDKDLY